MNCKWVETNIWRYIDREMPADDVGTVSRHLNDCGSCRKLFHECSAAGNSYRSALEGVALGDAFARKVVDDMQRAGLLGKPLSWGRIVRGGDRILRRVGDRRWSVAAAVVVLAVSAGVVGYLSTQPTREYLGDIVRGGAGNDGAGLENAAEEHLWAGRRLVATPGETVKLTLLAQTGRAGAWLDLECSHGWDRGGGHAAGRCELAIDPDAERGKFAATLRRGRARVAVVPIQTPGKSFVLRTPLAEVRVMGTRFVVIVDADGTTRLGVEKGRVELVAVRRSSKGGFPPGPAGAALVTRQTGWMMVTPADSEPKPWVDGPAHGKRARDSAVGDAGADPAGAQPLNGAGDHGPAGGALPPRPPREGHKVTDPSSRAAGAGIEDGRDRLNLDQPVGPREGSDEPRTDAP